MCACSQKEYIHCGRACVGRYIGEISQNYHLDKLVFVDGSAMSMHQPTMRRNRGSVMWGLVLLKRHPHLWNTACPLPYLLPRCRAPHVNKIPCFLEIVLENCKRLYHRSVKHFLSALFGNDRLESATEDPQLSLSLQ